MFGFITRAVFGLEVTENKGVVRISGIRSADFIRDINKTFGTSRVTVHMLNKATSYYVEFYSFFLIDFEYIVRRLTQVRQTELGRRGYIKMHEALMEHTWLSRLNVTYPSIFNKSKLSEIKFDLLKHQAEFIDYYDRVISRYDLRGILMAATPGSGKTVSSIAVACCYEAKNVIVISPKNAVFRVWEKTLLEDMNVKQSVWVHASGKPMPSPNDNRWYIFHYESLGAAIELANKLSDERCTIILDESHNLNEMKSLRTERFVNMCRMMQNSIIVELSGTPMKAMGYEAIPLISAIDPLFNDRCVEKFKKIYGREAKAATEILANRLGIIMYKVNKEESKIEEPIEHTLKVKVKDAHRFTLSAISDDMSAFIKQRVEYYRVNKKIYDNMYWDAIEEFEFTTLPKMNNHEKERYQTYLTYIREFAKHGYDPVSSPPKALYCNDFEKKTIQPALSNNRRKEFKLSKSVVKYVDLKIKGECLGTILSKARTECNKAILESLDLAALIDGAEKKTLVFTSYVDVVKAAADKLSNQGYKPLVVFADTNSQLPKMVKQFETDESINPMIATYQSLSTAVPLIMANRVILLNSPFRIHEKEQTVARANRIGQDKTVEVFNILLDTGEESNISTRSSDIMEWSREQVNAIMGFDNDDNSVALESILDDEGNNMEEHNAIQSAEAELTPATTESDQEVVSENDADYSEIEVIEKEYDKVELALTGSKNFVKDINASLASGVMPSQEMLESYWKINPPLDTVGLEADKTQAYKVMVSLEQEKRRSEQFLSKLIELLKKFIAAIWRFATNVNRSLRSHVNMATEMERAMLKSNIKLFQDKSAFKINGPHWLVRANTVSGEAHLEAMQWQAKTVEPMSQVLKDIDKELLGVLTKRLDDVTSQPGLNQSIVILRTARYLDRFIVDGSVKKADTYNFNRSTNFLGGRCFIFRYPNSEDEVSILKFHKLLSFKATVNPTFKVDPDKQVTPLTEAEVKTLLPLIKVTNKSAMNFNSRFLALQPQVDRFVARAEKYQKNMKANNPDQAEMAEAQTEMMITTLKGVMKFCKEYLKCIDKSSTVSFKYIVRSANGPKPTAEV